MPNTTESTTKTPRAKRTREERLAAAEAKAARAAAREEKKAAKGAKLEQKLGQLQSKLNELRQKEAEILRELDATQALILAQEEEQERRKAMAELDNKLAQARKQGFDEGFASGHAEGAKSAKAELVAKLKG